MSKLPDGFKLAVGAKAHVVSGSAALTFSNVGGTIVTGYLSAGAIRALGAPALVVIGVDAERGVAIVPATDRGEPGARSLTIKGGGATLGATTIARHLFPGEQGTRKLWLTEEQPGVLIGRANEAVRP